MSLELMETNAHSDAILSSCVDRTFGTPGIRPAEQVLQLWGFPGGEIVSGRIKPDQSNSNPKNAAEAIKELPNIKYQEGVA